jgi:FdhE protein
MTATTQVPIIPIKSSSEPPVILIPDTSLFADRAKRFDQLAEAHSLGDWLRFLAVLSRAQHDALQAFPELTVPTEDALRLAREHRMPPLPAQSWSRDPAWHDALRYIATVVTPSAPESARHDLARISGLSPEQIEALAERVLHTELYGEDAALLPYIGAALQVLWTRLAQKVGSGMTALDVPGVCPCCGFLPVASIVKTIGTGDSSCANLRYLHCALCNVEWNMVRVKCTACDATEGVSYRQLDGEGIHQPEAMRAETCESCKSYLKIVYTEKGGIDPVADDLATLALDILVDEAGYARAGPNLLLVPGSG